MLQFWRSLTLNIPLHYWYQEKNKNSEVFYIPYFPEIGTKNDKNIYHIEIV